ncbi:MAG: hypothetical protein GY757_04440 [bacterium]|nr:hypothetical protein [bacterium]
MKTATNIDELANNLIPEHFLKADEKAFYVPIYQDILTILRDIVIKDQVESQTFFVAGQAGTGKTTALNFFVTEPMKKEFHIKYINMRDFLDLSDVDIIDLLLAFAFALVENTELEESYYKKLVDLQKKHKGEILESIENTSGKNSEIGVKGEVSAGGGFLNFVRLRADFFSGMKMDSGYRKTTREVFQLKKPFLSRLVNEIINDYVEKVADGKKLLVIIDDLDKLKEVQQINSVFIENRNYIFNLACKKIISIPTYLTRAPEIFNYSQYPIRQFVLRLTPNPFDSESDADKEKIESNRVLMKDVVMRRIANDCNLIDDDALEKAVDYSGGIIRQLIRIVYVAAVEVRARKGEKISGDDINDAINLLRNQLAGTITSSNKIRMLNTILKTNIPVSEGAEQFIELLHAVNVLAYENGKPWYEVNPIIKDTVEVYASKQVV